MATFEKLGWENCSIQKSLPPYSSSHSSFEDSIDCSWIVSQHFFRSSWIKVVVETYHASIVKKKKRQTLSWKVKIKNWGRKKRENKNRGLPHDYRFVWILHLRYHGEKKIGRCGNWTHDLSQAHRVDAKRKSYPWKLLEGYWEWLSMVELT
mgnify:CR=1 FL=1